MWASTSSTTSWPGRVWARTETRLPWVPDVTKSPASLPSRSAASASRRRTVGSSSQTSSPTSARAIASRISGVGSVSVSERRSTTSCMGLALRAQPLAGASAEVGVGIFLEEPAEQLARRRVFTLMEIHLAQEPERLGDHERARVLLEHQLETLAASARVALVEVVGGDPQLLLSLAAPADVDLRQRVAGVAALRVFLDQLLELLEGLDGQPLVLLDRLDLIVVGHGQPVLHEVGDLMARVEGHEGLELCDGLVELAFPVEGLANEEA